MGLDILDDEEVEQDEEDREVEQLLNKGKEAKRKLTKGTYSVEQVELNNVLDNVQYSTLFNQSVEQVEQYSTYFIFSC